MIGRMDDLRPRVRELERLVDHLYAALDVAPPGRDSSASPQVLAFVAQGNLIHAIKQYREETGCDLRTAKDFVEGLS
jgi:ribosomal protein L7/L12